MQIQVHRPEQKTERQSLDSILGIQQKKSICLDCKKKKLKFLQLLLQNLNGKQKMYPLPIAFQFVQIYFDYAENHTWALSARN